MTVEDGNWRTAKYFRGPNGSHRRAIYKASGYTDEDLKRPLVAVVNTWGEVCPGHFFLRPVADLVKAGIWQSGGTPIEFMTISQCATPSLGLPSMRYDLAARDLVALDIETIVETQIFDAMVLVMACDKTIPGALLAAARLDIPTVIVQGGSMEVGKYRNEVVTLADLDEHVFGALEAGKADLEAIRELEDIVMPGPGACPILGTANTMQCLAEAVGMAMPYSATAPATSGEKLRLAKKAGNRIMDLIFEKVTARAILTPKAIKNMIKVMMTIGGSTNAVLHILALAYELGIQGEINLDTFDKYSDTTPCLVDVEPTGKYYVPDLHKAGGIPAVMTALEDEMNRDTITVSGQTIGEIIDASKAKRVSNDGSNVIRPKTDPVADTGGIAILHGNLAPMGSVARRLNNTIPEHRGPARCFDCQEAAITAINTGKIQDGDVIVVRHAGPRGAPGMPDIYAVLASVVGRGLEGKVAVVTDGRFSGFARGLGVCQVSPEAAMGGPLAVLKDGDIINISLPRRMLSVEPSEEIQERLSEWKKPIPRETRGMLSLYATNAEPAYMGARLTMHESAFAES